MNGKDLRRTLNNAVHGKLKLNISSESQAGLEQKRKEPLRDHDLIVD